MGEDYREIAAKGQRLVELMNRRMPEGTTEDEDGWITSYRIPVGPWHRLLAWSRSFSTGLNADPTSHPYAVNCPNGGDGCWWCGKPESEHQPPKGD